MSPADVAAMDVNVEVVILRKLVRNTKSDSFVILSLCHFGIKQRIILGLCAVVPPRTIKFYKTTLLLD
jgi:hypothetical protein